MARNTTATTAAALASTTAATAAMLASTTAATSAALAATTTTTASGGAGTGAAPTTTGSHVPNVLAGLVATPSGTPLTTPAKAAARAGAGAAMQATTAPAPATRTRKAAPAATKAGTTTAKAAQAAPAPKAVSAGAKAAAALAFLAKHPGQAFAVKQIETGIGYNFKTLAGVLARLAAQQAAPAGSPQHVPTGVYRAKATVANSARQYQGFMYKPQGAKAAPKARKAAAPKAAGK